MRFIAVLLAALSMAACGHGAASAGPAPAAPATPATPVAIDAASAERLAIAADDARRLAYLRADPGPLSGVCVPALLETETRRLAGLARRGTSFEEVLEERRVVHWTARVGGFEVVLALRGKQRVNAASLNPRPWSAFVRQTDLQFDWLDGHWLVSGLADLPPDRWWA